MTNEMKCDEAEHILKMLKADEIDHDEANARVWCLLDSEFWSRYGDTEFVSYGLKPERFWNDDDRESYEHSVPTGLVFKRWVYKEWWKPEGQQGELIQREEFVVISDKYTTSLDACQNIMQDGWKVDRIYALGCDDFVCNLSKDFVLDGIDESLLGLRPPMKTIPLAWLHVIIQAYLANMRE